MGYDQSHKTKISASILVLIASAHLLLDTVFVEGRRIVTANNIESVKHRGTLKTIESDSGDVIDCVDIYQQPAFDHPLLKNHVIEMEPSSSTPSKAKAINNQAELFQEWLKNGECPEGTIPIVRPQRHNWSPPTNPYMPQAAPKSINANGHEYAVVQLSGGPYHGAFARLNLWNPATHADELSIAQIWVASGEDKQLNTIEAGWQTSVRKNKTVIFIFWTSDGYESTGCYDLTCPGFVQISSKFAFGAAVKPLSSYNGNQYDLNFTVYKNPLSGNWWLQVQDSAMGYWPASIFTALADTATSLTWGGEIVNTEPDDHHTPTQMGSGHFPNEGYGKASYFRNLQYIDTAGNFKDPEKEKLNPWASKPLCYDVKLGEDHTGGYGTYFYFGGPGYSKDCPV